MAGTLAGGSSAKTFGYDLNSLTWRQDLPQRPKTGDHHGMVAINDKIYVVAGFKQAAHALQIFDPAANLWSLGPDMPGPSAGSVNAVNIGGLLYACGGLGGGMNPTNCYK